MKAFKDPEFSVIQADKIDSMMKYQIRFLDGLKRLRQSPEPEPFSPSQSELNELDVQVKTDGDNHEAGKAIANMFGTPASN